jgi:hypothetical protein
MQPRQRRQLRRGAGRRKDRLALSRDDYNAVPQELPVIDRKRPGAGYRHVLQKHHVVDFIALLPDWEELSRGLNAIVLAPGDPTALGWHHSGVVAVCAWHDDLWTRWTLEGYAEDRDLIDRLAVPVERRKGEVLCKWTEGTVRAYQLLDVLLHELGHHHDRITTHSEVRSARGEPYAEEYARRYERRIWAEYITVVGLE